MSSYTWYASGFGIVDSANQGVNDHSTSLLRSSNNKAIYVQFTVPDALLGKVISAWHPYVNVYSLDAAVVGEGLLGTAPSKYAFNPDTINYSNQPWYYSTARKTAWVYSTGFVELTLQSGLTLRALQDIVKTGLIIWPASASIYTPASNGFKIELTYENAVVAVTGTAKTIDPAATTALTWTVTGGTLGAPAQTAATVTYKVAGSATEHTISVTGDAKTVTVPAGTFKVGTTNAYKVSCTLEDGQTVESVWNNITVNAVAVADPTPSAGYLRNEDAAIFSWDIVRNVGGSTPISAAVTGGTLEWKNGSGGTVTSINTGTAKTYTMPANALPNSANIMWRLSGVTTAAGDNYSSDWYTVTTLESLSSAAITEPSSVTVDGSAEIVLRWSHIIDTGTAPTGFKIQTSTNGSTWTDLVTNVSSDATSYTVAANTFTSGTRYWRVQTYNSDGTAGSWSSAVSFVVVASPSTPAIAVLDALPRPQIRWTTTEQEGCEVTMDGVKYTVYGSEQTWRSPVYLEDGAHSVSVRVINQYGLWSEPGTAVIPVSNNAGGNIYLTVTTGSSAALSWESAGYDFFVVYRDGVAIAKTAASEYEDLFSCDDTIYRVRGCYDGSYNYGLSAAVPACVLPEALTIIDGATGTKVELRYFDAERGSSQWSRTRQAAFSHYSGQKRPSVEISDFEDEVLTVENVAIVSKTVKKTLCGLLGRLVCLKTPDGDMAVGTLLSLTRTSTKYFGVYSISVTNSAHEEAILL